MKSLVEVCAEQRSLNWREAEELRATHESRVRSAKAARAAKAKAPVDWERVRALKKRLSRRRA